MRTHLIAALTLGIAAPLPRMIKYARAMLWNISNGQGERAAAETLLPNLRSYFVFFAVSCAVAWITFLLRQAGAMKLRLLFVVAVAVFFLETWCAEEFLFSILKANPAYLTNGEFGSISKVVNVAFTATAAIMVAVVFSAPRRASPAT
jgi:hypothetical protein